MAALPIDVGPVCAHMKTPLIPVLIDKLDKKYLVKYNEQVDLLTIRRTLVPKFQLVSFRKSYPS